MPEPREGQAAQRATAARPRRERLGMGLVGPGFVGVHHVDAVRRLGFADVVAIADASAASAARAAASMHVSRSYGDIDALVADPDVDVVHVTTPNYLHARVTRAAIAHGKHVISEKPLAMTSGEARELLEAANAAGVVHAVAFNYRGNPMVQQMREMVAAGQVGPVHFVHGAYLQDWLIEDTDYSWRLEPDKGGRSSAFADIGSHWCDLAQHLVGTRIQSVLADFTTVVKTRLKPEHVQTFGRAEDTGREPVTINELARSPLRKAIAGAQYVLARRGPLAANGIFAGIFTRTDETRDRPNLQINTNIWSVASRDRRGMRVHDFPGFTMSPVHLDPVATGEVRLRAPDPFADPVIRHNFFRDEVDRMAMADAVRITRHIASQPALARYMAEEIRPGPAVRTQAEIVDWLRGHGIANLHPVGSCAMLPLAAGGVVDHRLRVHGIGGLYVADASIMPRLPAGNTNAPSIMIGERCAAMVLEDMAQGAAPGMKGAA